MGFPVRWRRAGRAPSSRSAARHTRLPPRRARRAGRRRSTGVSPGTCWASIPTAMTRTSHPHARRGASCGMRAINLPPSTAPTTAAAVTAAWCPEENALSSTAPGRWAPMRPPVRAPSMPAAPSSRPDRAGTRGDADDEQRRGHGLSEGHLGDVDEQRDGEDQPPPPTSPSAIPDQHRRRHDNGEHRGHFRPVSWGTTWSRSHVAVRFHGKRASSMPIAQVLVSAAMARPGPDRGGEPLQSRDGEAGQHAQQDQRAREQADLAFEVPPGCGRG